MTLITKRQTGTTSPKSKYMHLIIDQRVLRTVNCMRLTNKKCKVWCITCVLLTTKFSRTKIIIAAKGEKITKKQCCGGTGAQLKDGDSKKLADFEDYQQTNTNPRDFGANSCPKSKWGTSQKIYKSIVHSAVEWYSIAFIDSHSRGSTVSTMNSTTLQAVIYAKS